MALKIRRAAVLGAGVMGSQIAAHLAAAGVRTHLLDLTAEKPPQDPKLAKLIGKNYRSTAAITAVETLKRLKPSPIMSATTLANLIPGNFDDDMEVLADVDWVIEAVVEKMDIKKKLFKRIAACAPKHIPITSNTSGLSMAAMCEDQDEFFQKNFFGTHFFNPPRYLKLVEIVPHPQTDTKMMHAVAQWIEERLGKGVVYTNDTVNFIANRIGVFNLQTTLRHMEELGLNVETVDALTGKLIGRPASATFRTMDVVGIDVFIHAAKNVYDYAPSDPHRDIFLPPKWIQELVEKGMFGQKTNNVGIYKKSKDPKGKTEILAYHLDSKQHEPQEVANIPWLEKVSGERDTLKRLKLIVKEADPAAQLVWRTLRDTFAYSGLLIEEIANGQPLAVDQAMSWGFNWEWGPMQIWQALGYDEVLTRMQKEGIKLPAWCKAGQQFYKPSPDSLSWQMTGPKEQWITGKSRFEPIAKKPNEFFLPKFENKEDNRVVASNRSASLLDLGDGIACLTFHSKMNSLNDQIIELTGKTVELVNKDFNGLVIANEGEAFSAGADLRQILQFIDKKDFKGIDTLLRNFQGTMQMLKYAPFPSVAAPHGLTLGGGCELSLHTSRQILAGETYAGLVEVGVGLIPAGGGLKELALRCYSFMDYADSGDPMAFLQKAFFLVGMGRVSTSGFEAQEMGLYPGAACVSISRDHQIMRAKGMVKEMIERGYAPPSPKQAVAVAGDAGIQTFNMFLYNLREGGRISAYDAVIAEKIATVLCGGAIDGGLTVTENYLLELERVGFIELCQESKTRDRIEHMLKTGKPLRN